MGIPNMLKFITPAIEFFMSSQVLWLSPSQCWTYAPDPAKVLLESKKDLVFGIGVAPGVWFVMISWVTIPSTWPNKLWTLYSVNPFEGWVAFKDRDMLSRFHLPPGMNGRS